MSDHTNRDLTQAQRKVADGSRAAREAMPSVRMDLPAMTPEFWDWLVRGEEGSAQRERYDRAVALWDAGCTEEELAAIFGIEVPRDR
jgi:hypothetical protein